MGRLFTVLLMVATVCLTAAVTVVYTTPASTPPPDLRPLWATGGMALLLAFLSESSLLHWVTYRFEFSRPAPLTTQRYLGTVAAEGKMLLGRLNVYEAYEDDEKAATYWKEQTQAWTDWAFEIVRWRLPYLAENFANEADREVKSQDVCNNASSRRIDQLAISNPDSTSLCSMTASMRAIDSGRK